MTEDGTKANDTFLTIGQTLKKLGVNVYEYICNRVNKRFCLPSLAELIRGKRFLEKDYDTGLKAVCWAWYSFRNYLVVQ